MAVALTKDDEKAAHWKTQIEQCDKATEKWRKRAEKINKNYRDERDDQDKGAAKRLNLFFEARNVFDKTYYTSAVNQYGVAIGDPRRAIGTMSFAF